MDKMIKDSKLPLNKSEAKILEDNMLNDGMENLIAQLGTGMDKRSYSRFVNNKRLSQDGSESELSAMYRTDWVSGKVVDIIPNDMTREWRYFTGDITPEQVDLLIEEENRLELSNKINLAHKWARLYGTAFLVISVDDGQLPEMPLNIDAIKKGGLRWINPIDRHRLNHADVTPIFDPLDKNFGFPKYYRFNETSVKIHHSRVIRFDGVRLPYDEFRRNNFYSDSVLDRLYESITNFTTVTNSSASMVYEATVDAIKIKSLMSLLSTPEGEEMIRKRLALAGLMKSFNNMLLLDTEEELTSKVNTFTGLPILIEKFSAILASASDIPATRLLGTSAKGMNNDGTGDLKNYYDKIKADQKTEYKPKLDFFDKIMAKSLGLPDDADLSYEFAPLFQLTPEQQSTVDLQNAQRDQIYYDMDVVKRSSILKELQQNNIYTNIQDEDIEDLEEFENGNPDYESDPELSSTDPIKETEEKEVEGSKNA